MQLHPRGMVSVWCPSERYGVPQVDKSIIVLSFRPRRNLNRKVMRLHAVSAGVLTLATQ